MDVKFGKIKTSSNTNIFAINLDNIEDKNFFANSDDSQNKKEQPSQSFSTCRLNDYDSHILENNAYHDLSDETFKIEHKMELLEENLNKINLEIDTIESLGYDIQLYDLKRKKEIIIEELNKLNEYYSTLGVSTKISGKIASILGAKYEDKVSLKNLFKSYSKKILAKISKKIDYAQKMRDALNHLNAINSSVDELIKMQTPYGEAIDRYEKLTAFLNKANHIHSQINVSNKLKKA